MIEVLFFIFAPALISFLCLGVVPFAIVELVHWADRRERRRRIK